MTSYCDHCAHLRDLNVVTVHYPEGTVTVDICQECRELLLEDGIELTTIPTHHTPWHPDHHDY